MTEADVVEALRAALNSALWIAAPPLIAATAVGLAIALIQALTQIQELTLTFVPKYFVVLGVTIVGAPGLFIALRQLSEFLFDRIAGGAL